MLAGGAKAAAAGSVGGASTAGSFSLSIKVASSRVSAGAAVGLGGGGIGATTSGFTLGLGTAPLRSRAAMDGAKRSVFVPIGSNGKAFAGGEQGGGETATGALLFGLGVVVTARDTHCLGMTSLTAAGASALAFFTGRTGADSGSVLTTPGLGRGDVIASTLGRVYGLESGVMLLTRHASIG